MNPRRTTALFWALYVGWFLVLLAGSMVGMTLIGPHLPAPFRF
ncbi:hypothetical protein [Frankia canadensis]|nr:hypothetical protein [Frankia canadensis]